MHDICWKVVAVVLLAGMVPARAAVPIAVLDLDYVDRSGEVRDQQQEHEARLLRFVETLRADLASSGRYRIVSPVCDPAPCAVLNGNSADLMADARKAGAQLMMFGGVQKMSTLIQWAKLLVVDVQTDRVVFDRLITFRGDDDESWKRAEAFSVREFMTQAGDLQ